MRPILSGILGAVIAHVLVRWLGRRFPVGPKPQPLEWYAPRYQWVGWLTRALFFVGIGVALWVYRTGYLPKTDPRGAAVGFALACLLPLMMVAGVCAISPTRRVREYWEFEELKDGARNVFALYLVLPVFGLSVYGAVHLLVNGR